MTKTLPARLYHRRRRGRSRDRTAPAERRWAERPGLAVGAPPLPQRGSVASKTPADLQPSPALFLLPSAPTRSRRPRRHGKQSRRTAGAAREASPLARRSHRPGPAGHDAPALREPSAALAGLVCPNYLLGPVRARPGGVAVGTGAPDLRTPPLRTARLPSPEDGVSEAAALDAHVTESLLQLLKRSSRDGPVSSSDTQITQSHFERFTQLSRTDRSSHVALLTLVSLLCPDETHTEG